jgi:hypothetical protein
MSLIAVIKTTSILVRGALTLAVFIRDSQNVNAELKEAARFLSTDLTVIGGILDNLLNFAQRVSPQDEIFLCKNIELLNSIISEAKIVLEDVQRDRNLFQRVFMKKDDYLRKLREISKHLNNSCVIIQGALPTINRIEIPRREFPDFRRIFQNKSDKHISFYDFMIIRNTFNSVLSMNFEDFDAEKCLCYMKLGNEQVFFSYQLRTWSALHTKTIVREQHQSKCEEEIRYLNNWNSTGNYPAVGVGSSTPPSASSDTHKKLNFLEFFMSHDDICGMTLTQSMIYIATKCEITVFSLDKQKIIAQYGIESDGSNSFNHISSIYVPPNDETCLYIVDRGQNVVHQYKINDSGLCFEFVRRYVVIANVNQQCNLIACAIFNRNLYVSDDANNCLHIFPVNGGRQSTYLADNSLTPFSPGSLCTHGKYLYVANRSRESPGILVFNEECEPVDWFRNRSLTEILAIDIEPNRNKLYILTSVITKNENETVKKGPMIVSMDLLIHT